MVLSDLARSVTGNKAITMAGGIASLVALLHRGSIEAQKHAACALWGLTSSSAAGYGSMKGADVEGNMDVIVSAGAVPTLVELISTGQTSSASKENIRPALGYAVATLNNLSLNNAAQVQMLEGGAIDRISASIALNGPETWLRSQAVELLLNLGVNMEHVGPDAMRLNIEHEGHGKKGGAATVSTRPPLRPPRA